MGNGIQHKIRKAWESDGKVELTMLNSMIWEKEAQRKFRAKAINELELNKGE